MTAQYTQDQFAFIVEQLACGESPDAVAALYVQEFTGAKLDAKGVKAFAREKLPADWQDYFDACRATFKVSASTASGDRDFMLALLDKWMRHAGSRGAHDVALKYAELIEKIRTGFFGGKAGSGVPGQGTAGNPASAPVTRIELLVVDPKPIEEPAP